MVRDVVVVDGLAVCFACSGGARYRPARVLFRTWRDEPWPFKPGAVQWYRDIYVLSAWRYLLVRKRLLQLCYRRPVPVWMY